MATARQILEAGLESLKAGVVGWCQGDLGIYVDEDAFGDADAMVAEIDDELLLAAAEGKLQSACALGHLILGRNTLEQRQAFGVEESMAFMKEYGRAKALLETKAQARVNVTGYEGSGVGSTVAHFNDKVAADKDQVIDLFKDAIVDAPL